MHMWTRVTRWAVAALVGSAMTTIGCARVGPADDQLAERVPVIADDSLTYAFDTSLEARLADRLDLDNFLRDRDIYVAVNGGSVELTGEVWTPLERQRAADLVRNVAGVTDVANHLIVRAPE